MNMILARIATRSFGRQAAAPARRSIALFSSTSAKMSEHVSPRHFLSIADLSSTELTALVRNALAHKEALKSGHASAAMQKSLANQTFAVMFTKRSTRTRVSTESALVAMGGHPMFLGAGDIQLGVNESLYDTSVVISSMVAGIVARVNAHSDVTGLAENSSVPVINALSDSHHPMQTVADFLTIYEQLSKKASNGLGLEGLKIAWVGDANNVLYDLAIGAMKLGVEVAVATPKGFEIPAEMRSLIQSISPSGKISETNIPEEAVRDADVIVTDTWVSMGQEEETARRMKAFEGFQVTEELASRGGAKKDWRFMHCLPRHPEEVDDAVFYGSKSHVFQEAENRLWAAIAVFEAFFLNKGKIV